MFDSNTASSMWLADFSCNEENKEELLKDVESASDEQDNWNGYVEYRLDYDELKPYDDAFKKACNVATIRYCLESGFANDVLTEEEVAKCETNFNQKQYNFKLFKKLLSRFCYVIERMHIRSGNYRTSTEMVTSRLKDILRTDIRRYTLKFREEEVEKSYAPLKRQIEKITSGVKGVCYRAGEGDEFRGKKALDYRRRVLSEEIVFCDELNESLKSKYGYDFNAIHGKAARYESVSFAPINSTFCKILLNDNEFWEKHKNFDAICFIESVNDNNGQTHAEKILFYIFDEILKSDDAKEFAKRRIPLDVLDRNLVMKHFENHVIYSCYPFANVEDAKTKLEEGKAITVDFFKHIYPNDWQRVLDFIDEYLEKNQPITQRRDDFTMAGLLDIDMWCISNKYRQAVKVFCPQFFSCENVWNRFYLKIHAISKSISDDKTFYAQTFEKLFYLIDRLNETLNLNTVYQHDSEGRDKAFKKLKDILARYGINPSEEFKENYVISLLDTRVAQLTESAKFPMLEQLGDAIYGFAVAENMFYNLYKEVLYEDGYAEGRNLGRDFEDFTRAEAQIAITRKIGLDKLFISPASLQGGEETAQSSTQRERDKDKYLADMLEMVIGSVCKEFGYDKAIKFVKRLLQETYPDKFFKKEVRWFDDVDEEQKIQRYYWTAMRPALYSDMGDWHKVLWRALDKVVVALSVGTQEESAREFITYRYGKGDAYGDKCDWDEVNRPFYDYLQNGEMGLQIVLEKYSKSIKAYYEKVKADKFGN